jgi:hypothetical protein
MWRQPGRVASHAIRQVAFIHDVVSLIHRVGVMPDKLFCHRARHASTLKIAHSRAVEVVRNAARQPGGARPGSDRLKFLASAPTRSPLRNRRNTLESL